MFGDLAAGKIVGVDRNSQIAPATFWDSDVHFDLERGDMFARHDRRMPLMASLHFRPSRKADRGDTLYRAHAWHEPRSRVAAAAPLQLNTGGG